ncbi:MAG: hypothetical protein JWL85_761, partial [Candidatus Saccharibacteria bacterium]|nr:hypothetical protein [Candidatus Saccharibacteria bacterium]
GSKPGQPQQPQAVPQSPEQIAVEQQRRFEAMRAKLLGQDARTD